MAIFDEREQKIVVRVVYDGPALAGKTTNLEQLCRFFTPLRRSELYSPKALAGRTLFFDWMQLEGGVVAGYGLRCHLVTVPGQAVLSRRRWHLLDLADVVVFVTSSTKRELDEARPMYNLLRDYLERTNRADTPILVQANKQDLPGAAEPHAVVEALGAPGATAVAANADTGAGVRETVVLAIRAAAERAHRTVLEKGLEGLKGDVLEGEALMHDIAAREKEDPKTPVSVVMGQYSALATREPKAGSARITNEEEGPTEPPPEAPTTAEAPTGAEPEAVIEAEELTEELAEELTNELAEELANELTEARAQDSTEASVEPAKPEANPTLAESDPPGPSSEPVTARGMVDSAALDRAALEAHPEPSAAKESRPPSSSEIDSAWSIPAGPPEVEVDDAEATPPAPLVDNHAIPDRYLPETLRAPVDDAMAASAATTLPTVEPLPTPNVEVQEQARPPSSPPPSSSRVLEPLPPLPKADVPSGLVWPSANGREILQRVPTGDAILHKELAGRSGTADGSGRSDAYIYEAGIWCLKTAARRRYVDGDEARTALLQLVRHKILLGDLLVQNTVLTVQQGPAGDYWLWTVTPWLTTLRGSMTHAVHRRDRAELERSLVIFGELAVRSLVLASRSNVLLDVHPSNFACLRNRCYYLDDDIARGSRLPAVGFSLLRRVDEYAEWPAATEAYVNVVAAGLAEHLDEEDVEKLDLRRAFQDAIVRSPAALAARERFLAALDSIAEG